MHARPVALMLYERGEICVGHVFVTGAAKELCSL